MLSKMDDKNCLAVIGQCSLIVYGGDTVWVKIKVPLRKKNFCTEQRHPMSGKSTLLSLLYCPQTSNIRKIYIAHTFVLYEDIQCQESLHCNHFCIVHRHPMSGKSTLLSLLYCSKTSNVRKVYIAITFVLCEDI